MMPGPLFWRTWHATRRAWRRMCWLDRLELSAILAAGIGAATALAVHAALTP